VVVIPGADIEMHRPALLSDTYAGVDPAGANPNIHVGTRVRAAFFASGQNGASYGEDQEKSHGSAFLNTSKYVIFTRSVAGKVTRCNQTRQG
jgi:hypothetical protein